MTHASWLLLDAQDPRYLLPADLRDSDVFSARDVGWVEQMRPFIAAFSAPGDLVLDPFAGFGTTLVAAALEGRRGIGIEADAARARKTSERLARLGLAAAEVHVGDCARIASSLPKARLVLTSVPYFACAGGVGGDDAQRYLDAHYAVWLERMRLALAALAGALERGGTIILMAENLRIGAHFVPQAWDLARLLGERFVLHEERVIVYPRESNGQGDAVRTNRAHEYALVARNEPRALDVAATLAALLRLQSHGALLVYGSFARHLHREEVQPSDADVLLEPGVDVAAVVGALAADGFRITRWGAPVASPEAAVAMRTGFYLTAERLDRDGRLCRIDVAIAESAAEFARRAANADVVGGLRCEAPDWNDDRRRASVHRAD